MPPGKIDNYLLSLSHPGGKNKAVIYRRIGFNDVNRNLFERALLVIAHTKSVTGVRDIISSGIYYGKSYEIIGIIRGPRGNRRVKTVWKILSNTRKPSLVTVSPM